MLRGKRIAFFIISIISLQLRSCVLQDVLFSNIDVDHYKKNIAKEKTNFILSVLGYLSRELGYKIYLLFFG